jgi:phosphoribosylformimino-5-aminoimidazole carboxamide ribotide isomerase
MSVASTAARLIVVPAIDLRHGRVVRLLQGDVGALTEYDSDPRSVALRFQAEGAERLHVVDLDAAVDGNPQFDVVARIIAAVKIPVGVGGGVRTTEVAKRYRDAGADRIVFGTAAVTAPAVVQQAAAEWPAGVAVAIDAKRGLVMITGWTETTPLAAVDLARRMGDWGVGRIQYTDVSRDGTLRGLDLDGVEALSKVCNARFTIGGGVAELTDIGGARRLLPAGVDEIIVGKALYDGRFSFAQAQRVARRTED